MMRTKSELAQARQMNWLSTRYDEFFKHGRCDVRISAMIPVLDAKAKPKPKPKPKPWDNCQCECGHVASMHEHKLGSVIGLCLMAGCDCRKLNVVTNV